MESCNRIKISINSTFPFSDKDSLLHMLHYWLYPNTTPKYFYNATDIHAIVYHIRLKWCEHKYWRIGRGEEEGTSFFHIIPLSFPFLLTTPMQLHMHP